MATIEELVVQLTAETRGLQAELKGATAATQQATKKMQDSIDKWSDGSNKKVSAFQDIMKTMAGFVGGQAVVGAFNAAKDAALAFAKTMAVDSVKAAAAQQEAVNQLNDSMARSGHYSREASESMQDFAAAMQQTSTFEDDVILKSAALIQNLADLDTKGLQRATKASADFAAAMSIDINTASNVVGKALAGNVGALARYGIEVDKGATATQTMANVLDALGAKFEGAASSKTRTFSGSLALLKNTFGDLQEEIGNAIVQNPAVVAVFQSMAKELSNLAAYIKENKEQFKDFFTNVLITGIDVMKGFVDAAGTIKTMLGGDVGMLEEMSASLDRMGSAAQESFSNTVIGADNTVEPINRSAEAMNKLTEAQIAAREQAVQFAEGLVQQTETARGQYDEQVKSIQARNEAGLMSDEEAFAVREAALLERYAAEQAMLEEALAAKAITEQEYAAAQITLANQAADEQIKIESDRAKRSAEIDKTREQNFKSTMGTIATLASSGNKTLAGIGKAAAITQATIDGYAAVQKALASAPPPINYALAAAVGAATASNVAKIVSTPAKKGIDSVPGIGTQDNFPAILAPGERVVPTETNKDLTKFLEEGGSGRGGISVTVQVTGPVIGTMDFISDLADKINEGIRKGVIPRFAT